MINPTTISKENHPLKGSISKKNPREEDLLSIRIEREKKI